MLRAHHVTNYGGKKEFEGFFAFQAHGCHHQRTKKTKILR